jgi:hypothetical protein
MDTPRICTFTEDEMRCERVAVPDFDRCDRHPRDGGLPASASPSPSPKSPSTFEMVKNLLAVERLMELGGKTLGWIERNIPPDIFGTAEKRSSQFALLRQAVEEQDPATKQRLASRFTASLTAAQLLVIVGLAVAASAALNASSAGSSSDA